MMSARFSALLCLVAGIVLSFWGFIQPPESEISASVLYFFSECLIYSGAIFGVKLYIKSELQKRAK